MHKPPSWNQIRTDATAFATRWADDTDENAGSQTFWNEFLAIFGIDRKRVATFEARAQRVSTGGRGRIDLLWPGVLVAEHKSAGKDLASAEDQAIDYLESIGDAAFPGYVITSDFARMRIRDLGGDNIPFEFPLKDLPKEIDRFGFIAGYSSRRLSPEQEHQVDIAAAQLMGSLYEELAEAGLSDHEISVLLVRLLLLLFGDDTGLWERGLFLEFLETRTQTDGSDLGPQLALLFQTLDRPGDRRPPTLDELLLRFPYVNGGLYADRLDIPVFTASMRTTLIECCHIDWGSIVPAIFGSLFQAVKSKEARRSLGEHYTTEENILRVIRPLFLDALNARVQMAWHDARKLQKIRSELGEMRFLDPACGCGNFLVIVYREMRRLELRIMLRLRELTGEEQLALDATLGLQVSPSQFFGIEIEEWPARIAETAIFLVDHQMNLELAKDFGEAPDRLPISGSAEIRIGNALRMDWADLVKPNSSTYVMGNPPFLGSRIQSDAQKDDREIVWGDAPKSASMDYVANWFIKAGRYIQGTAAKVAFVATNSITQGEQPAILWGALKPLGLHIDFAYRPFTWSSEAAGAAAVHVVIIGFSATGSPKGTTLYTVKENDSDKARKVSQINAYLSDGPWVLVSAATKPLLNVVPPMKSGSVPRDGGWLSKITAEEAKEIQAQDATAAKYLRRVYGAEELINDTERWCLWLVNSDPKDLRSSTVLRERIAGCQAERKGKPGSKGRAAATPALFADRHQPQDRFLCIPSVSSQTRDYIPMAYLEADDIVTNAVFTIERAPLWLFGVLSSSAFTEWVRAFSSRMKSDYQIGAGPVYNTFPFIRPDGDTLKTIEAAAQGVLDARATHSKSSLADLYDPLVMPAQLRAAHNALDKAILALYGLKPAATEADILAALIARYKELEAANQLPLATDGTAQRPGPAPKAPSQTAAVRAWAARNGFTVPARGRIPRDVLDAYNDAHGGQGSDGDTATPPPDEP